MARQTLYNQLRLQEVETGYNQRFAIIKHKLIVNQLDSVEHWSAVNGVNHDWCIPPLGVRYGWCGPFLVYTIAQLIGLRMVTVAGHHVMRKRRNSVL